MHRELITLIYSGEDTYGIWGQNGHWAEPIKYIMWRVIITANTTALNKASSAWNHFFVGLSPWFDLYDMCWKWHDARYKLNVCPKQTQFRNTLYVLEKSFLKACKKTANWIAEVRRSTVFHNFCVHYFLGGLKIMSGWQIGAMLSINPPPAL